MAPASLIINPLRNKRSPITSSEQPICQICKKQISKYTCPSCNLHYCCLSCFRSDQHLNCSERFDKNCLKEEIQSEAREGERNAMEEILKKFEEESLGEELELEEEDRDLGERFSGLSVLELMTG